MTVDFDSLVATFNKKHYTKEEFKEFTKNRDEINKTYIKNDAEYLFEVIYNGNKSDRDYLFYALTSMKEELDEVSTITFTKHKISSHLNEENEISIKIPKSADYSSDFSVTDINNNEIPFKIRIPSPGGILILNPVRNKEFKMLSFLSPFSQYDILIKNEDLSVDEIYIWHNAHLLNNDKRSLITKLNEVGDIVTSTNKYRSGFCYSL